MKPLMILCCFFLLVLLLLPAHVSTLNASLLQITEDVRFHESNSSGFMHPRAVKKISAESEELEFDFDWKRWLNYAFHNNESLVLEVVNKFPAHVTLRSCDKLLLESVSPITNSSIALGPYWVQYLRQTSEFEEVEIRQDANRVGLYNVKIGGIVSRALTQNNTEQMVIKMGSGGPIRLCLTKCNLLLEEIITINDNRNYEVDKDLLVKMRMLDQTVCGTETVNSGLSIMVISDHRLAITLSFNLQPRTTTTQPPPTTTTEAPAIINVDETGVIRFSDWIGEGKAVIDLRQILEKSPNFMLMMEIESSEPMTFNLEKQHRELIGRFTLKFSTGGIKASGHFRFSKSEKIKTQDAGRMNTKEIVNIHQDSMHPVVYYLALGKLIGDAIQNRSLTLRLNSSLPGNVDIGFGKCETNSIEIQLNATDSLVIDQDLLEHMDRMNNLFCILDRNLGRFDLTVSSPTPVNGTLHFGFDSPTEKESFPVLTAVCGTIFGLLVVIGLCVFLVRRHQNRARIVLRRNKPATVFENRLSTVHYNTQFQQIDFSVAFGPVEELDYVQSDSGSPSETLEAIKLKKMKAVDRVQYRTERLQENRLSSGNNTIRSIQENRPCTSVWVNADVYGNNAAVSDVVPTKREIDGEEVEIDETELYVHDDSRVFFV
ncbi:hypothetical protein GCK72_022894 [Caenorhabditis remanei]|uniref:Uncharacterized protein n=1 Tax=Caenorhabditis remanei TaxID=31234 RepID=A0A6A5FUZ4_CAERE|nr:hypothetical protein GCK72_022894 [Caenorhabditis remanei]KAF1746438.1 hypothetical protein GCK72_022894 [Caenorhabditis remanei]